jgi:putative transposase
MKYRNYDPRVKQMVIRSRNPNLFPDLRIPRTTALYWINHSKDKEQYSSSGISSDEIKDLKQDNFKLKAKNLLLREIIGKDFSFEIKNSLKERERRKKIIEIVESFKDVLKLKEMLDALGISFSTYYRYRSEILGCHFKSKHCDSSYGRSLSHENQKKMIELAQDKKFAHFSTRSLAYYAQKEGILTCGADSWYKYLRHNQVERPRIKKIKQKKYEVGIRATKPYELCHIDVTQVKTINLKKVYLQLIVDNFSRAILSYKVGEFKNLKLSFRSLNSLDMNKFSHKKYLMSDRGGENLNEKVKRLLIGKGITHLLAKTDIKFSNSIVEAVFRQMKRVEGIRSPRSINSFKVAVKNYVEQHNNVIPHSSLKGSTPIEVLTYKPKFDYRDHCLKLRSIESQIQSRMKKQCRKCAYRMRSQIR